MNRKMFVILLLILVLILPSFSDENNDLCEIIIGYWLIDIDAFLNSEMMEGSLEYMEREEAEKMFIELFSGFFIEFTENTIFASSGESVEENSYNIISSVENEIIIEILEQDSGIIKEVIKITIKDKNHIEVINAEASETANILYLIRK